MCCSNGMLVRCTRRVAGKAHYFQGRDDLSFAENIHTSLRTNLRLVERAKPLSSIDSPPLPCVPPGLRRVIASCIHGPSCQQCCSSLTVRRWRCRRRLARPSCALVSGLEAGLLRARLSSVGRVQTAVARVQVGGVVCCSHIAHHGLVLDAVGMGTRRSIVG
jgi:hypothetical protein